MLCIYIYVRKKQWENKQHKGYLRSKAESNLIVGRMKSSFFELKEPPLVQICLSNPYCELKKIKISC